jgi:competence ComEA-like helix-hairpin-helix protein
MFFKKFIKDYLIFNRRDRIGIIAVLTLGVITYLLPRLFIKKNEPFPLKQSQVLIKAIDTLNTKEEKDRTAGEEENAVGYQYQPIETKTTIEGSLFEFDPNTLPVEGWEKLGLSVKTGKTIDKYRTKGGKFYKPEDLKKIWGLPAGFYERVKNYISIAAVQTPYEKARFSERSFEKTERKIVIVNINEADTSAFIALPGIGSKLAARIVAFRDKLGGFYSVDQVGETFGLPDSTFQKIRPLLRSSETIRQFNINTATKEELKTHPYIKWALANAIIEYRTQHGNFKTLEELKNIALIDEEIFRRIVPYLAL